MNYEEPLNRLLKNVNKFIFVGLNSNRYDTVMLNYLLQFFKWKDTKQMCKKMFEMSKDIVINNAYAYQLMADNKVKNRTYEIDLKNYLGAGMGAKEMGCRLHHPKLETLPFNPNKHIEDDEVEELMIYCENDVDINIAIYDSVKGDIDTALEIIDFFDLDMKLSRKTTGQIVEVALTDPQIKPNPPETWRYKAPVEFNFKTQVFKDLEDTFKGLQLTPDYKFSYKFDYDGMEISAGLGGGHGAHKKKHFEGLIDIDANQYYPMIVYTFGMLPDTVKDPEQYGDLIGKKEHYASIGKMGLKNAVKKTINTVFGKTGDKHSKFYAPDKLLRTTITGQLLLMRLIEDLKQAGFQTVYFNTDGITIKDNGDDSYKEIAQAWADEFKMKYEVEFFKRAFYRDVNNFIAEGEDGDLKLKGDMSLSTSKKVSCFGRIATKAVIEHLLHGTSIRDYIDASEDLRDFLMYHKYNKDMRVWLVSTGKKKRLTNVVRYAIMDNVDNAIMHDKGEGTNLANRKYNKNVMLVNDFEENKDGIVPLPENLDKEAYVKMAFDILQKMNGQEILDNPYIEGILEELGVDLDE